MTCELYCLKIFSSKCGKWIISKSQVGLGDIVDVFQKYGKKNLGGGGGGGKHPPCGLGLITLEGGQMPMAYCSILIESLRFGQCFRPIFRHFATMKFL